MHAIRHIMVILSLMLALIVLAACGGGDGDTPSDAPVSTPEGNVTLEATGELTPEPVTGQAFSGTVTVFAAASLTDAFTDIGRAFSGEYPDATVQFSFGGSSGLATQLSEGAPADVFAAANLTQMQVAQEAGRIAQPVQTFAGNELVVVVSVHAEQVQTLDDLRAEGLVFVLAAPGVPVRDYTDQMLDAMAFSADYGEDYRDAVLANLASEETDVRQVIAKVALGEADAGVVYRSDVTPDLAEDVRLIDVPAEFNVRASYPIAVTDNPSNPDLARLFVNFVLSDAGQSILESWGLIPAAALVE